MKEKIKKVALLLGGVTAMIVACIALGFFGQNEEDVIINRIVGIVAIISGIGSVIMGIASIVSASLDNVREYYATGDTAEMIAARRVLYNYRYIKIKFGKSVFDDDFDEWVKENIKPEDTVLHVTNKKEIFSSASLTINFFQMWGLLQYKGFLPIWVFETASGYSVIKLYEAVDDIVKERLSSNPFYGGQFKELCVRIGYKYRKAIIECRNKEADYIMNKLNVPNLSSNEYFHISLK